MANVSRPWGFRPVVFWNGNMWNAQTQVYAFSAAQANDAYVGDVVQFDNTNRTAALTDAYYPGVPLVKPVVAALTVNIFRGVIVGFLPQPYFVNTPTASLGTMFRAASTVRYVAVAEDVNVIFEAEETSNSYVTALNNGINKTADILYAAGSQVTGISAVTLDGTSFQTAAVRPWFAHRYTPRIDNFNFSAADVNSRAHFNVLIANSDLFKNGTLGA
jgi:hypothetical protein